MRYTFIHFTVTGRDFDEITHTTQEDNLPRVAEYYRLTLGHDCEISPLPGIFNKAHSLWFTGLPDGHHNEIPPRFGKGIAVYQNPKQP